MTSLEDLPEYQPTRKKKLEKEIEKQEIDKWICTTCMGFGKHIVRDALKSLVVEKTCEICETVIKVDDFAYSISEVIKYFLKIESNLLFAYEQNSDGLSLEKIIRDSLNLKKCNSLCVSNTLNLDKMCACVDLCEYIAHVLNNDLSTNFFKKENRYRVKTAEEIDISSLKDEWLSIEKSLTHENRYFNIQAKDFFNKILFYATLVENEEGRYSILTEICTDQELYRARTYKDADMQNKIKNNFNREMYAPVPHNSSNNRMSASGVSLLYLGDKVETCKAELDNSDSMIFAKFKINNTLIFFDFTKFDCNFQSSFFKSVFEYDYEDYIKMQLFFKYCINNFISALMENNLDYVMTQAFCNHIQVWSGWGETKISGVIYKSAKYSDGKNYAIFDPHKCLVKRNFHITLHDSIS